MTYQTARGAQVTVPEGQGNMSTQYRIKAVVDTDFDIEGTCEFQEDKDAHYEHGTYGFIVERLVEGKGTCLACGHTDADHWEHVDSRFGFAGNDMDYMLAQAREAIPYSTPESAIEEIYE